MHGGICTGMLPAEGQAGVAVGAPLLGGLHLARRQQDAAASWPVFTILVLAATATAAQLGACKIAGFPAAVPLARMALPLDWRDVIAWRCPWRCPWLRHGPRRVQLSHAMRGFRASQGVCARHDAWSAFAFWAVGPCVGARGTRHT